MLGPSSYAAFPSLFLILPPRPLSRSGGHACFEQVAPFKTSYQDISDKYFLASAKLRHLARVPKLIQLHLAILHLARMRQHPRIRHQVEVHSAACVEHLRALHINGRLYARLRAHWNSEHVGRRPLRPFAHASGAGR